MNVLGIDLGGTKLAAALFSEDGVILKRKVKSLEGRKGNEVSRLITDLIKDFIQDAGTGMGVDSIGICVPGISYSGTGMVWAPNIPGWDDYPLMERIRRVTGNLPVLIDSDRVCNILGEVWKGNARGYRDVIFMGVGTGIGAGIVANGEVLRGSHDIAGAIGWMALNRPFKKKYIGYGCFEYHASGEGIARVARDFLRHNKSYTGILRKFPPGKITSRDVFDAFDNNDPLAQRVIKLCIEFWGMAAANLVSLFNPEKIIFSGGVFGPAKKLIPLIKQEAEKWAQPLGIRQVVFDISGLEGDAGIYGAGYLALRNLKK